MLFSFQGSDWSGLSVSSPFSFAEAVVVVVVDGVSSLGWKEGHRYSLITDEDESVTWQSLHDRVLKRYPGQNATLLRMDFAEQVEFALFDSIIRGMPLFTAHTLNSQCIKALYLHSMDMDTFLLTSSECITRCAWSLVT
jgi:hypothetical protein